MPALTSANVAQAIVKLVAADALPALVANLVMGNLVNRNYEGVLAQAGDTVNVPIAPNLSSNNIAEGGTVTTQNPSLGNAQIVLNTHVEATFQVPDVTKVLAVPDLLRVYMQPAVIAIAEKIETDLLALYANFTANAPAGTYNTAPTEAAVDTAETVLFKAKVPASSPKFLVVSGDAYSQIRQIPRFTEYRTIQEEGARALMTGEVGEIKGFRVFRCQLVSVTGGTSTHNLAFAPDAVGLVIRRLPQPIPGTGAIAEYVEKGNFGLRVIMSYQPNTLAQQFTVDCLYGAAVLRNNFGLEFRS